MKISGKIMMNIVWQWKRKKMIRFLWMQRFVWTFILRHRKYNNMNEYSIWKYRMTESSTNLSTLLFFSDFWAWIQFFHIVSIDPLDKYTLRIKTAIQLEFIFLIILSILVMVISATVVLAPLLTYVGASNLQTLNGNCLLFFWSCLVLCSVALSYVHIITELGVLPSLCKALTFILYFTNFATFVWMSVTSFSVWFTSQWESST